MLQNFGSCFPLVEVGNLGIALSVEQLEVLKARFGVCLAIHLLQKGSGLLDYLTQSISCANEADENCV